MLVFRLQNGAWTYLAMLTASSAGSDDYLGTALDIRNGAVLAGAPGNDTLARDTVASYVCTQPWSIPPSPPAFKGRFLTE